MKRIFFVVLFVLIVISFSGKNFFAMFSKMNDKI
jgi:hypothetical protein